ncbi:MAG: (2Fe-2S)-binding protein [Phycisphaerales bacterium]|nr:(2Fe-2S)-binding protein [Phycisphaerales bacterium]
MAIGGVLVAAPIIGAAVAPGILPEKDQWISLGAVTNWVPDTTVLIKFSNPGGAPDDGITRENACYVRCMEAGKFQVFAVNCAHLGCPVEWFSQSRLFMCPCHGGVYYEDGSRASGPPPRGLFEFAWRIQDGMLEIFSGRLPGLQEGT